MRRVILISIFLIPIFAAPLLVAFAWGSDISSSDLEAYLRKHTVDGQHPVAVKKRSLGGVSYLANRPISRCVKTLLRPTTRISRNPLSLESISAKS